MNLKNDLGQIVEVHNHYPPSKNGIILAKLGGFSYFQGVETKESPTHFPIDCHDLFLRGTLCPILKL